MKLFLLLVGVASVLGKNKGYCTKYSDMSIGSIAEGAQKCRSYGEKCGQGKAQKECDKMASCTGITREGSKDRYTVRMGSLQDSTTGERSRLKADCRDSDGSSSKKKKKDKSDEFGKLLLLTGEVDTTTSLLLGVDAKDAILFGQLAGNNEGSSLLGGNNKSPSSKDEEKAPETKVVRPGTIVFPGRTIISPGTTVVPTRVIGGRVYGGNVVSSSGGNCLYGARRIRTLDGTFRTVCNSGIYPSAVVIAPTEKKNWNKNKNKNKNKKWNCSQAKNPKKCRANRRKRNRNN